MGRPPENSLEIKNNFRTLLTLHASLPAGAREQGDDILESFLPVVASVLAKGILRLRRRQALPASEHGCLPGWGGLLYNPNVRRSSQPNEFTCDFSLHRGAEFKARSIRLLPRNVGIERNSFGMPCHFGRLTFRAPLCCLFGSVISRRRTPTRDGTHFPVTRHSALLARGRDIDLAAFGDPCATSAETRVGSTRSPRRHAEVPLQNGGQQTTSHAAWRGGYVEP